MEAILIPETREIQEKSATIVQWAYGLLVTVETYPKAGELLRSIKALEKSVSDTFDVPIEAAHKAHKAILAAKAQHMDPLVKAEGIVKGKMGVHIQEQERIRAEQQRIADAAARKAEEDARLAEAQVLEEIGETEAAEAVIEEPIVTAPVILPPAVEKVEGVSSQVRWKFEVMDLKALLLAVAKGEVPIQALQPNEVFIGQQVRSLRDAFRYPGVKAWPEKSISSR